jgi:hypothetical protein
MTFPERSLSHRKVKIRVPARIRTRRRLRMPWRAPRSWRGWSSEYSPDSSSRSKIYASVSALTTSRTEASSNYGSPRFDILGVDIHARPPFALPDQQSRPTTIPLDIESVVVRVVNYHVDVDVIGLKQ